MKVENVKWIAHVGDQKPSDVELSDLCIAKCYYADEENGFYVEVFDTDEIDWHIWKADGDIMEYAPLHGYTRYFSTGVLAKDERISLATKSGRIYTVSPNEWNIDRINVIPSTEDILCAKRYHVQVKSLSDAILDAVKELTDECGSFSIWEITKRIRRKMENGTYVGDSPKHLDIKNQFLSMQWTDYDISTRIHGVAEYRYYEYNPTHAIAPVATDEEEEIDVNFNVLLSYIHGRSNAPTMKQIQSRFKKGTCKAWVELCRKAGIQLIDSKHPSKVKVKSVA